MRLDLHMHSRYSPDSKLDPIEMVKVAKARGLDGIAITDHNAVDGAKKARAYGDSAGVLVIVATEVSTADGHVLAYGVDQTLPRDRSARETVEDTLALAGVPVAAHPYRFWSGLGEEETLASSFAAYEAQNARTLRRGNTRAQSLAAAQRVGLTGGSDAHFYHEIGRAVTIVDGGSTEGEVLEALRGGTTHAEGTDRGAGATAQYVTKAVGEWIARGFRRI
ncbi:MAG TPA: CehA/McbA family metallohydrolase [Thermoplasmata archaeon]|nr:CehA/McbA family metallohydrolase [Thermoplasmata archaeon]